MPHPRRAGRPRKCAVLEPARERRWSLAGLKQHPIGAIVRGLMVPQRGANCNRSAQCKDHDGKDGGDGNRHPRDVYHSGCGYKSTGAAQPPSFPRGQQLGWRPQLVLRVRSFLSGALSLLGSIELVGCRRPGLLDHAQPVLRHLEPGRLLSRMLGESRHLLALVGVGAVFVGLAHATPKTSNENSSGPLRSIFYLVLPQDETDNRHRETGDGARVENPTLRVMVNTEHGGSVLRVFPARPVGNNPENLLPKTPKNCFDLGPVSSDRDRS